MQQVHQVKESKDKGTRLNAMRTFNDTVDHFTKFLEAYGYKSKIADKIEHLGAPIEIQINNIHDKYPTINAKAEEVKSTKPSKPKAREIPLQPKKGNTP